MKYKNEEDDEPYRSYFQRIIGEPLTGYVIDGTIAGWQMVNSETSLEACLKLRVEGFNAKRAPMDKKVVIVELLNKI